MQTFLRYKWWQLKVCSIFLSLKVNNLFIKNLFCPAFLNNVMLTIITPDLHYLDSLSESLNFKIRWMLSYYCGVQFKAISYIIMIIEFLIINMKFNRLSFGDV